MYCKTDGTCDDGTTVCSSVFRIEKIDKSKLTNVTKNFEDIFTSQINDDISFSKMRSFK